MAKGTGNTGHGAGGARVRLDRLLVDRGLAESREQAQRLIMAGQVCVPGQHRLKAGIRVAGDTEVSVVGGERYVSRGALKLEAGLHAFAVEARGKVCADVGASTGGFTDCLLQAGAARVYSIDVGKGQLHQRLREDARVVLVPDTNARDMRSGTLPEPVQVVCVDLSFISLHLVLPALPGIAAPDCDYLVLVKPQFEATPAEVSRGKGVVADREVHLRVLRGILSVVPGCGLQVMGIIPSPVLGRSGNREYVVHLRPRSVVNEAEAPVIDIDAVVSRALTMERFRSPSH